MTDAPIDLENVCVFIRELAKAQAQRINETWKSVKTDIERTHQKNARDFATQLDVDVENDIKQALGERFPLHGLCGKETDALNQDADFQWLIDPIDGTKYFANGSTLFAVSIGLRYQGEPILGVVVDVMGDRCYWAYTDGGSHVDDTLLNLEPKTELGSAIVNIDTPKSSEMSLEERDHFHNCQRQLFDSVYRVRALGIASLALCWLATGALDAYIDLTGYTRPADITAGLVIAREAGAQLATATSPTGPPRLVVAAPSVNQQLRTLLEN